MSDTLREHLAGLRARKNNLEQTIDGLAPTELGSGRLLRCASRHWPDADSIFRACYGSNITPGLAGFVARWVDVHDEYEFMAGQDAEVLEEIRADGFRRALEDSKNWKF